MSCELISFEYLEGWVQPFRDLQVWRKAHELALRIYTVTETFPRAETFGLSTQLRRLSVNIPLRIAEGCGREGHIEFQKCLHQARATGFELEYLFLLGRDLQLIESAVYDQLQGQLVEVRKMLSGLIKSSVTAAV
jgi:four helix bundle protein